MLNQKIGIVIVTYNRLACLKKNLDCIQKLKKPDGYMVQIFLIDNASTDGTYEYIHEACYDIFYYRMKENTGGSGGFSTGVQMAYQADMDLIWGMDDDAYVDENALCNIIKAYEQIGTDCGLVSNSNFDKDGFKNGIKKVNTWMFVGFFLTRKIISEVGMPRNDFFIYFDDIEYAERIMKHGYTIYKVKDSIINHRISGVEYLPEKKFLFWKVTYYKLPDWKMYYLVRNKILKCRKKSWEYFIAILKTIFIYLKISFVYPMQKNIVKMAIRDGIHGTGGKVMEP